MTHSIVPGWGNFCCPEMPPFTGSNWPRRESALSFSIASFALDRDEMVVDELRQFRVLVGLAVDHMAPVAPRSPDVQEDRPIELLGTPERLLAPRIPVDRLVRRSLEVGGSLLREAIGTVLRHPTDACTRSLWPFGTRPRDHFR